MKILTAFALLALAGCATCQQHPVYCAIGSAVLVGSVAAIVEHHNDERHQSQPAYQPLCAPYCIVQ